MKRAKVLEKTFSFKNALADRKGTNRIVIHHTGGADIDAYAEQIHNWHLDAGYSGIGYHFVIRKDGKIERGRPQWAVGSHAYGANYDTIGIHLSGCFTYTLPTEKQIESAALLIADLCEEYNLPVDRKHILGHREVDPDGLRGTACPGNMLQDYLDVLVGKANWYRYGGADTKDKPAEPPKPAKKPLAGMLSEHFAESEFTCKHCGKGAEKISPRLIELLEQLRYNIGGYPLHINSGYRCPTHNANVGGVPNSQHVQGTAADIACPPQLSFGQFKWYVDQLPFDGIGIYEPDFIHVDVRNGGKNSKIYWEG